MDRAEAIGALRGLKMLLGFHAGEALDMAIAALREQESLAEKQATSEWISVEERLPDPFVSVLGYCPDEEPLPTVHECYLGGYGQWCSAQMYDMEKVTHWMPLPEPPEEGAEG